MTTQIAGVLLAAGAGRRFGGRKLLHPLPGGSAPLGILAWEHLRSALSWSVVVVRTGDEEVGALYRAAGAQVVVSAEAERGMGHSLASGVRATASAAGWVIGLADMPRVQPQTIRMIAQALASGARIAVPVYQGARGHPVGFSASLRDRLLACAGDAGARALLQEHAAEVVKVAVDDCGVLQDVDTPEDLARVATAADRR
jgi:molybdenum cofactor cytidylyltransferase